MTFAVIGTFHRRYEKTFPLMHRLFVDGTRKPDEAWLMCETEIDAGNIQAAFNELADLELVTCQLPEWRIVVLPTPRDASGGYAAIPYSNKINWALDRTTCDAVVYLDNNSMPSPEKYGLMADALDQHPEWDAVYVTQKRTGYLDEVFHAREVVPCASGRLNYTQVMHRVTDRRWPRDMRLANPDLADSVFFETLGPLYPVGGDRVHDDHHMPSPAAEL